MLDMGKTKSVFMKIDFCLRGRYHYSQEMLGQG